MALALYRKYRPATFAEVVGQEHVTTPLMNAVDGGRINHAYLFSGPRGCGKTSSARILARSLNCEQGPTSTPCGVCESCVALAPDGPGSLDVMEIDAASHGGVDDARDLRERAFFAPVSSRYKVYIVDEAHMVTTQGFNALLKVVEEPPDFLVFVFATTEPEKVLPTIRSRTHHYPFRLVPPTTLRSLLEKTCAAEGVQVEPTVFPLVVRAGGGSVRDSLSILDQLLAGAGPEGVTYRSAVGLLGVTDDALLDETIDALAASDAPGVFRAVDRVVEAGHDPRRFATDLLDRMRDLIVLDAVPDAGGNGLLDCPPDRLDLMNQQAQALGSATLSRMADTVHEGLAEMRGTTAPRLLLELVCARMLLPATDGSAAATLQRLERLERRMSIAGEHAGRPAAEVGHQEAVPAETPRAPAPAETPRAPAPTEEAGAARREFVRRSQAQQQAAGRTAGPPQAQPAPAAPARQAPAASPQQQAAAQQQPPPRQAPAAAAAAASAQPAAPAPAPAPSGDDWPETATPGSRPRSAAAAPAAPADDWPETAQPGNRARTAPPAAPAAPTTPAAPAAEPARRTRVTADEPDIPLPPEPTDDEDWPHPAQPAAVQAAAARLEQPRPPASPPRAAAESAPAPRGGEPTPVVSANPPEAASDGELTTTDVRRVWPELLAVVKKHKRTTEALLKNAQVHQLANGVLTLSTSSPALARRLGDDLNKDVLREALNELLGVRWRVDAVVEGAGPAAGARNAAPEEAREAARAAEAAEARELMAERAAETSSDGDREPAPAVDQEQAALQLLRAQLGARPVDG
ncbi:DNA polymerase III subunit gamma and tau [Blastococcus sp. VKM Ac-2987]|uniref:DNA polymerase III subunit gamma and tau n=1 Tax=Blastococcus sp. VKM Ac-2987 TaxID=3004141 RepID=UPI0022AB8FDB|nr:DNA polymerase III subunit gamma and tau [Blastococcus sp. VKM Ac-2987]MCZ2858401.1 DNA polymerase III subunit gamma and tau [Blastococcus sp. VKM Ac-2987]